MERLTAQQISTLPEWIPIEGFHNYEVNCREGIVKNSRTLRILKPRLGKNGYPYIGLCKNGKEYTNTVHRLVALTAFGYYNISTDGLFVCHLDEERNDPRIANLALGTNKENMGMPKAKQRNSESKKGEKSYWFGKHKSEEIRKKMSEAQAKKAVGAYKNGELIMTFQSTAEAGKNGFNQGNISSCCTGKLRTHKGFQWRFLDTTAATMVG